MAIRRTAATPSRSTSRQSIGGTGSTGGSTGTNRPASAASVGIPQSPSSTASGVVGSTAAALRPSSRASAMSAAARTRPSARHHSRSSSAGSPLVDARSAIRRAVAQSAEEAVAVAEGAGLGAVFSVPPPMRGDNSLGTLSSGDGAPGSPTDSIAARSRRSGATGGASGTGTSSSRSTRSAAKAGANHPRDPGFNESRRLSAHSINGHSRRGDNELPASHARAHRRSGGGAALAGYLGVGDDGDEQAVDITSGILGSLVDQKRDAENKLARALDDNLRLRRQLSRFESEADTQSAAAAAASGNIFGGTEGAARQKALEHVMELDKAALDKFEEFRRSYDDCEPSLRSNRAQFAGERPLSPPLVRGWGGGGGGGLLAPALMRQADGGADHDARLAALNAAEVRRAGEDLMSTPIRRKTQRMIRATSTRRAGKLRNLRPGAGGDSEISDAVLDTDDDSDGGQDDHRDLRNCLVSASTFGTFLVQYVTRQCLDYNLVCDENKRLLLRHDELERRVVQLDKTNKRLEDAREEQAGHVYDWGSRCQVLTSERDAAEMSMRRQAIEIDRLKSELAASNERGAKLDDRVAKLNMDLEKGRQRNEQDASSLRRSINALQLEKKALGAENDDLRVELKGKLQRAGLKANVDEYLVERKKDSAAAAAAAAAQAAQGGSQGHSITGDQVDSASSEHEIKRLQDKVQRLAKKNDGLNRRLRTEKVAKIEAKRMLSIQQEETYRYQQAYGPLPDDVATAGMETLGDIMHFSLASSKSKLADSGADSDALSSNQSDGNDEAVQELVLAGVSAARLADSDGDSDAITAPGEDEQLAVAVTAATPGKGSRRSWAGQRSGESSGVEDADDRDIRRYEQRRKNRRGNVPAPRSRRASNAAKSPFASGGRRAKSAALTIDVDAAAALDGESLGDILGTGCQWGEPALARSARELNQPAALTLAAELGTLGGGGFGALAASSPKWPRTRGSRGQQSPFGDGSGGAAIGSGGFGISYGASVSLAEQLAASAAAVAAAERPRMADAATSTDPLPEAQPPSLADATVGTGSVWLVECGTQAAAVSIDQACGAAAELAAVEVIVQTDFEHVEAFAQTERDSVEAFVQTELATAETLVQTERDSVEVLVQTERDSAEVLVQTECESTEAFVQTDCDSTEVLTQTECLVIEALIQTECDLAESLTQTECLAVEALVQTDHGVADAAASTDISSFAVGHRGVDSATRAATSWVQAAPECASAHMATDLLFGTSDASAVALGPVLAQRGTATESQPTTEAASATLTLDTCDSYAATDDGMFAALGHQGELIREPLAVEEATRSAKAYVDKVVAPAVATSDRGMQASAKLASTHQQSDTLPMADASVEAAMGPVLVSVGTGTESHITSRWVEPFDPVARASRHVDAVALTASCSTSHGVEWANAAAGPISELSDRAVSASAKLCDSFVAAGLHATASIGVGVALAVADQSVSSAIHTAERSTSNAAVTANCSTEALQSEAMREVGTDASLAVMRETGTDAPVGPLTRETGIDASLALSREIGIDASPSLSKEFGTDASFALSMREVGTDPALTLSREFGTVTSIAVSSVAVGPASAWAERGTGSEFDGMSAGALSTDSQPTASPTMSLRTAPSLPLPPLPAVADSHSRSLPGALRRAATAAAVLSVDEHSDSRSISATRARKESSGEDYGYIMVSPRTNVQCVNMASISSMHSDRRSSRPCLDDEAASMQGRETGADYDNYDDDHEDVAEDVAEDGSLAASAEAPDQLNRSAELAPAPTLGFGSRMSMSVGVETVGHMMDPSVSRQPSPLIVQSIARSMVGTFMHKYTPARFTHSGARERRHLRYFWIHPYAKMLNWSKQPPSGGTGLSRNTRDSSSRSAFMRSVYIIAEPLAPEDAGCGEPEYCIVVVTDHREIKIKATTQADHDLWYMAMSYLQSRRIITSSTYPTAPTATLNPADYLSDSSLRSRGTTIASVETSSQRTPLELDRRSRSRSRSRSRLRGLIPMSMEERPPVPSLSSGAAPAFASGASSAQASGEVPPPLPPPASQSLAMFSHASASSRASQASSNYGQPDPQRTTDDLTPSRGPSLLTTTPRSLRPVSMAPATTPVPGSDGGSKRLSVGLFRRAAATGANGSGTSLFRHGSQMSDDSHMSPPLPPARDDGLAQPQSIAAAMMSRQHAPHLSGSNTVRKMFSGSFLRALRSRDSIDDPER